MWSILILIGERMRDPRDKIFMFVFSLLALMTLLSVYMLGNV